MAVLVGEILAELATAIETAHSRLSRSPTGAQEAALTDGHGTSTARADALRDMQAAAQDLREAVNACMHSMPTRFWVDALVARVRALGRPELAAAIDAAERKLAERFARP